MSFITSLLLTTLLSLVGSSVVSASPIHRLATGKQILDTTATHHIHNLSNNITANLPEWTLIVIIVASVCVGLLLIWGIIRCCTYDRVVYSQPKLAYSAPAIVATPVVVPQHHTTIINEPVHNTQYVAAPAVTTKPVVY